MKKTIGFCEFTDSFNAIRPDNFTYDGLRALYDWFEQYEDDTGEDVELDVIAICCEFTEYDNLHEVADNYGFQYDAEDTEEDEQEEEIMNYLNDRTFVIKFDNGVIIQDYQRV